MFDLPTPPKERKYSECPKCGARGGCEKHGLSSTGIADALEVNDKRFVPHFYFCEPQKPGRVEVRIGG